MIDDTERPLTRQRSAPMRPRSGWLPASGVASLVLLAACQAPPAASAAAATPTGAETALGAEAALLARIRTEIGAAACTSTAQCHTLATGTKACGGPDVWLAWSDARVRADKLQAWAAELARLQRARHERSGIASNCQYNADPGALCREQRCVVGGSQPAR